MYLRPGEIVVIVGMTLTSLSTVVVFLRYYCRWYRMGVIGVTDHLMMIALILTWGNTVINYYQDQTSSKFRPSFFRIPEKRPLIEGHLHGMLLAWYIYRMSYGVALCFVKLSILFFYRAIASQRTFRRIVYGTIGFVILYTFATTVAAALQCEKLSDSFDSSNYLAQFDGDPKTKKSRSKCYDPTRLWLFTGAVNLCTDVLILLLPIPALLSLRVPMTKRLVLVAIFSVGIMAIVASCVRMWVMALWAESPSNSAKFGSDLLMWGQVEVNSGIVSASVPFLRSLLRSSGKEGGRSDEKKYPRRRIREIGPPKVVVLEGKTEMGSYEFFGGGKDGKGDGEEGGEESPGWGGFITVPASLSSASRGSTHEILPLKPEQAHMTV